jgi:predicted transcriptional regulator
MPRTPEAASLGHVRHHRLRPQEVAAQAQRLTRMDVQLLQALLRYPFSRPLDIALARNIHGVTAYRHLLRLHEQGLVERVSPAILGAGSCWLYYLTNVGLHVLAANEQGDAMESARTWRTQEDGLLRLLPRLPTLFTLQNCINALVRHAPRALAHKGRASGCRWHWVRDYRCRFTSGEEELTCAADALLVLKMYPSMADGKSPLPLWYSLFLLLDLDINDRGLVMQRVRNLLLYRQSRERSQFSEHFPLLLVLVTQPHRQHHWQRAWVETRERLGGDIPLQGAIGCLPDESGLLLTDTWRLAWRTLAGNAPCHLQEVLTPLPFAAIPPGRLDLDLVDDGVEQTGAVEKWPGGTPGQGVLPHIILGQFEKRSQLVRQGKLSPGTVQEQIGLLSLSLSRRSTRLLKLLMNHPYLSADEMAAFLALESNATVRYLRELDRMACVGSDTTVSGRRWYLSERGLQWVAAAHHLGMSRLAAPTPAGERPDGVPGQLLQHGLAELRRHVLHTAGIYSFFAALARAAREQSQQGHRLLWWETGGLCERRYRDHDRWYNLRPDGMGAYLVAETQMRFWLEWDRGTLNGRDLAGKFHTYARFIAHRMWVREQEAVPLLLVVGSHVQYEAKIRQIAYGQLAQVSAIKVATTNAPLLKALGPLGAVWQPLADHGPGPEQADTSLSSRPRAPLMRVV